MPATRAAIIHKNRNDGVNVNSVRNQKRQILFSLLSGVLICLSFPKFGFGVIAWIAFVPLLMALQKAASIRQAFLYGWMAGIMAHTGLLYWIFYVVVHHGHLPVYLGIFLLLLLAAYLSLYVGLFAAGVYGFNGKAPMIAIAPALWIVLEFLKSYLFTGFPWENLGYSQYSNIYFIQIADVAGVHALSFLIMILNVAIYDIMVQRSRKVYLSAAVVVILWAGVYAYGTMRINQIGEISKSAQGMNVSLIQGNIDQSVKWNENYRQKTLDIYTKLSLGYPPGEGGLMVWPETAVPYIYQPESYLSDPIRLVAKETGAWMIFGAMRYVRQGEKANYFNSACLLSADGAVRDVYDKVHLVPYGEYVPLRKIFPFVSALAAGLGDFTPGKGYAPLIMGEHKIGVTICYEGILPSAARKYKQQNAELLVNLTNDAWFGETSAPYQHLSMSILRAVESRLYLVRAANTGFSAIVDPTGRIVAQTGLSAEAVLSGRIKFMQTPTLYARYGDWIVFAACIMIAVLFLYDLRRRIKNVF